MDISPIMALITFAALVTPPGAAVAAVLVRYAAELAKRYVALPGDVLALVVTVLLYVAAAFAATPGTADGWLNLVVTALLCLGGAIGFDGVLEQLTASRANDAGGIAQFSNDGGA